MSVLAAVALAHALAAALFTLVCVYAVWSFAARSRGRASSVGPGALPRVFLLRATERVDAAFVARASLDPASYSGELRRVVCVPSLDAVRVPLGDEIALAASGIEDLAAVNRKAAHLEAGVACARADAPFAPGDVIVHADADVVLAPGDLDRLVASLERDAPDGASFAPPAPGGGGRLAELVARAILVASPQAFAVVWSLARLTRSEPALAGKLVAMRAATLDAIGGYAATKWAIADDIALVAARCTAHAQRRTKDVLVATAMLELPVCSQSDACIQRTTGECSVRGPAQFRTAETAGQVHDAAAAERIGLGRNRHGEELQDIARAAVGHQAQLPVS